MILLALACSPEVSVLSNGSTDSAADAGSVEEGKLISGVPARHFLFSRRPEPDRRTGSRLDIRHP